MSLKGSPLKTVRDLDGKTIGIFSLNDAITAATRQYLSRGGVDPGNVHFVELPFTIMGEAIKDGRIDAGMLTEPILSQATRNIARVFAKPFDAVAPEFLLGVWFATDGWVKANLETARRFATAMSASGVWANRHHDETAASLAKFAQMDVASVRATTRAIQAESLSPQLLQPILDVAFTYKMLPRAVQANELIAQLR